MKIDLLKRLSTSVTDIVKIIVLLYFFGYIYNSSYFSCFNLSITQLPINAIDFISPLISYWVFMLVAFVFIAQTWIFSLLMVDYGFKSISISKLLFFRCILIFIYLSSWCFVYMFGARVVSPFQYFLSGFILFTISNVHPPCILDECEKYSALVKTLLISSGLFFILVYWVHSIDFLLIIDNKMTRKLFELFTCFVSIYAVLIILIGGVERKIKTALLALVSFPALILALNLIAIHDAKETFHKSLKVNLYKNDNGGIILIKKISLGVVTYNKITNIYSFIPWGEVSSVDLNTNLSKPYFLKKVFKSIDQIGKI